MHPFPPTERPTEALGGANSLFTSKSALISGSYKSPKARGELGASERRQVNEFSVKHGNFTQVRTQQARGQNQCLPPAGQLSPCPRQRGAEIWKAPTPKPGCRGRELRVVGSRKKKIIIIKKNKRKKWAKEATRKEEEEEAKRKR